jgi:glycosyltransferase involved in cell wall biosynthesis
MPLEDPQGEVVYVASNLYQKLATISANDVAQERNRWKLDSDDVVVGFMGRLVSEKGAEELIGAAKELQASYPKLKYLIVGTGKGQMHNVEEELHNLVKSQGLDNVVKFAGYQTNEALYYSLFDIFVLTTRDFEAFATTVVQAMMAKKPVIGTDAGGTRELVENEVTGLLIKPEDSGALAKALCQLMDDVTLRDKLAKAGNERVLQYHREEIVTDQVEAIFNEILGASKKVA